MRSGCWLLLCRPLSCLALGTGCCGRGRAPRRGDSADCPLCALQELEELQKQLPQYLRNLRSEEDDVLVWHALLLPVSACAGTLLGRTTQGRRPAGRARPGEDFPCRRILLYYYFYSWLHRVSIAARGLSLVAAIGGSL